MHKIARFIGALVIVLVGARLHAQPPAPVLDTPCYYRSTALDQPWVSRRIVPCLEEVIHDRSAGELAFTQLAVSPENVLYAASPLTGEILALTDDDGDGLPETPRVVITGLIQPNGLAFYDGALYITAHDTLYRWREGVLTALAAIPAGGGLWTGSLAIGRMRDDAVDRIYLGTGARCDDCADTVDRRGAILSYALDGSDQRLVARGLRQPADLAFYTGDLWTIDSAPDGWNAQSHGDELNLVEREADFGFPGCIGVNMPEAADCTHSIAPALTFPTGSQPIGMIGYDHKALPSLRGSLLIALGGSRGRADLQGYQIVSARRGGDGAWRVASVLPAAPDGETDFTLEAIQYRGGGIFPHRPYDVAVNGWGWIYMSIGGGRILAIRPQAATVY